MGSVTFNVHSSSFGVRRLVQGVGYDENAGNVGPIGPIGPMDPIGLMGLNSERRTPVPKTQNAKLKTQNRAQRVIGIFGICGTLLPPKAEVAKLEDAPDLGSGGEILRGSSPLLGMLF